MKRLLITTRFPAEQVRLFGADGWFATDEFGDFGNAVVVVDEDGKELAVFKTDDVVSIVTEHSEEVK